MIAADSVERTANNSARAALQQPAPGRPRRRGHRGVVPSAPTSRTSRPDARGAAGWCRHCCPARRRRDTAVGLRCSSWRPPPAYEAARAPRWPEVPGADFSRPPRANADESRKSKLFFFFWKAWNAKRRTRHPEGPARPWEGRKCREGGGADPRRQTDRQTTGQTDRAPGVR